MNSNINNLIYIDTLEAYTLIQNDFDNVTDLLITDNPLLANNPIIDKNIFDISKLLTQEKNVEIGGLAGNSGLRAANFIDKYIRNYNDKI